MKPQAQVEYRPIKDLKELPGNPRIIKKDQFEKLKKSIQDNQDYFEARPIILSDRTGELVILAENQSKEIRCGDNGIFKGVPVSKEESRLSNFVRRLYEDFPTDGKFIYDESGEVPQIIMCQSNASNAILEQMAVSCLEHDGDSGKIAITVNPLGEWTGGTNVDTGATNRKLGSDMGRAVTGGGLHGKDLSKADVAVNIMCHLMAQDYQQTIEALCAIGDDKVAFRGIKGTLTYIPYAEVVKRAGEYIKATGGFEKLAEWGLF